MMIVTSQSCQMFSECGYLALYDGDVVKFVHKIKVSDHYL